MEQMIDIKSEQDLQQNNLQNLMTTLPKIKLQKSLISSVYKRIN